MNIKFYTQNLAPGEVARFVAIFPAPWGEHHCNGIIHVAIDPNAMVVLWPDRSEKFSHFPGDKSMFNPARDYVLDAYKTWRDRK